METATIPNQRTILYDVQLAIGGKMMAFAGFEMPVRYSGDKDEHNTVRTGVGIFDASHMGEFMVRGPKALDLIQKVTSNDASILPLGKAQYSCLPNSTGGIVDDLIVYHLRDEEWMLVVNASNIEKDWNWILNQNTMGAEMIDISSKTALIAVSGPLATEVVSKLTSMPVGALPYYGCIKGTFNGFEDALVATTGYTGERTYEIFVRTEQAVATWNAIMEAGKEFGIKPYGLGARDTLRTEMGYMLYGNDIDDTTNPLEAGLGWITKPAKGDFVGKEHVMRLKEEGLKRKLVGFIMTDKGIPRHGYSVVIDGVEVGLVTSGTQSPILNEGIGMAYVPVSHTKEGSEIGIKVRDKILKAMVVKTPFIKK